LGLVVLFAGALLKAWWLTASGLLIGVAALLLWFWPRRVHEEMPEVSDG
jgi:hypothetical protein